MPDQRLELFRRALVFVLPSHMEGFGLTAVEAMIAAAAQIRDHGDFSGLKSTPPLRDWFA
jgi:glycosyltransferase involved in cell wall biosynthesis